MAFVDARSTGRNLGAGAAVLAIEGALGLALIAGLSGTFSTKPEERFYARNIPTKPADPLPPPPDTAPRQKNPSEITRIETPFELPNETGPTLPPQELTSGGEGKAEIGSTVLPEPTPTLTPPEPPRFKPRRAAPKNSTAQWVTTNDYPTSDLRGEHQGTTGYRLLIDASGAVSDCAVTSSSGWPGLDKATCEKVKRRARFEPASDETGARTAGSYSGSVTWRIPED